MGKEGRRFLPNLKKLGSPRLNFDEGIKRFCDFFNITPSDYRLLLEKIFVKEEEEKVINVDNVYKKIQDTIYKGDRLLQKIFG
jgi:hypothetical protein